MKKSNLIALLIMVISPTLAQNIDFTYDAAGNRIKREVVLTRGVSEDEDNQGVELLDGTFNDRIVKIFPNSQESTVKITISGFESDDECSLQIYFTNGVKIRSQIVTNPITIIDLSGQQQGVYLLQIILNGKSSSWRVIKN